MSCFDDESIELWPIDSVLPKGYYVIESDVPDMYKSTDIYRRVRWWFWDTCVAHVDGNNIEFTDRKAYNEFGDLLRGNGFTVTLK